MTCALHQWVERARDENDNRIRTVERCQECGAERMGTLAKRLSPVPDRTGNFAWWGTPGEWFYSELRAPRGDE